MNLVDPIHGSVKKENAIGTRFKNEFPQGDISVILKSIENDVIRYANENNIKSPQQNAFNNARGDWLEIIVAAYFWNMLIDKNLDILVLRLPNVGRLEFTDIFDNEAQNRIKNGLMKSLEKHNARLDMSNPDLIGVRFDRKQLPEEFKTQMRKIGIKEVQMLLNAYKYLIGKCSYDSILFGVSIKTSLRGDRRYQIVHEGSIVKAFIAHLQTRYWDTAFETNFYGAVTNNVSAKDHEIFRTAATHSIVNVFSPSVRAVDKVFHIPSTNEVESMIEEIIECASVSPQVNREAGLHQ